MKTSHLVSLMQQNYTTVSVQFQNEKAYSNEKEYGRPVGSTMKTYTYKIHNDLLPLESPFVIVESPVGQYQVVNVIEVHDTPDIDSSASYDYKWVIDKVHFDLYDNILQSEKDMTKAIRTAEREKARHLAMQNFYEHLENAPQAKKLFEEAAKTGRLMSEPKAYEVPKAQKVPKAKEAEKAHEVPRAYEAVEKPFDNDYPL